MVVAISSHAIAWENIVRIIPCLHFFSKWRSDDDDDDDEDTSNTAEHGNLDLHRFTWFVKQKSTKMTQRDREITNFMNPLVPFCKTHHRKRRNRAERPLHIVLDVMGFDLN